jgi:hypothetical protein
LLGESAGGDEQEQRCALQHGRTLLRKGSKGVTNVLRLFTALMQLTIGSPLH